MENLFFFSSKILWQLISPDNLFVILLVVALLLRYVGKRLYARRIFAFLIISVVFLGLFPLGSWLLYPLENRFQHNPKLPDRVDGVILLGGSVMPVSSDYWQQLEVNDAGERLNGFVDLARQFPNAQLVFTGGSASITGNRPTEASILKLHLDGLGIDTERVVFEDRARNTAENAFFTRQLVNPAPDSNWVVITTAYHMPRSIGVFCHYGWSLIPYPVDHRTNPDKLFELNFNLLGNAGGLKLAMHEWVGLLAYYLNGSISQLFPENC
jgi:uncharacterized SAM-binding protein YcdF (DUF218 family)